MDRETLQSRANKLSKNIFEFIERLPSGRSVNIISNQIMRSAASVRINYRAIPLSKSKADFINKINVIAEEADETYHWLEFIEELGISKDKDQLRLLMKEAKEIAMIFSKSLKTAKQNSGRSKK